MEKSDETKFCEACASGDFDEVIRQYESNRKLIHQFDQFGFTALHWACLRNKTNIVEWLLKEGANINSVGPTGANPVHWAAQSDSVNCLPILYNYILETVVDKDEVFIKETVFCSVDSMGLQPIHYASQSGSSLSLHYLVCIGCDINVADNEGHTPLHWAAHNGSMETCLYLLNLPECNKNAVDKLGFTPLHWATKGNHLATVQILTQAEVNLTVVNLEGKTARNIAEMSGNRRLASNLRSIERSGYYSIQILIKINHFAFLYFYYLLLFNH